MRPIDRGLNKFLQLMKEGKLIYKDGKLLKAYDARHGGLWLKELRESEEIMKSGYKRVHWYFEGKPYRILSHRLIYAYFNNIDKYTEDDIINHVNGDKSDNCIDNLELGTYQSNTHHAWDSGYCHSNKGENNGFSKLTGVQVKVIRDLIEEGKISQGKIAKMFGISPTHVSAIKYNRVWEVIK